MTYEEAHQNFEYRDGVLYWRTAGACRKAGAKCGSPDSRGYLKVQLNRKSHYIHRVVWLLHYGAMPKDQVDHINRDKADNRIENLRAASQSINNFNRVLPRRNKTGAVGVERQVTGRFRARVGKKTVGTFATVEQAAAAREAYMTAEGIAV
jgi:hypothetical protein